MLGPSQTQVAGQRYARGCTVSVWEGERFLGSGFFITKGVVATCAHVLARSGDRVRVLWRGAIDIAWSHGAGRRGGGARGHGQRHEGDCRERERAWVDR